MPSHQMQNESGGVLKRVLSVQADALNGRETGCSLAW